MNSIPVCSNNISSFSKTPQFLGNLSAFNNNFLCSKKNYQPLGKKNIFNNDEYNTNVKRFYKKFKFDVLNIRYKIMKFYELIEIQKEAQEDGIEIDEKTIKNAIDFLYCIFNDIIEIPYISYNELKEVSFTWDTLHSRIYVTIDKNGLINFNSVEYSDVNEISIDQARIESPNKLITRIKNVF